MEDDKKKSAKNTSILAVASVLNIGSSIVKNKVLAILIGPAGLGIISTLTEFINIASTLGSVGIANSGVQSFSNSFSVKDEQLFSNYKRLNKFYLVVALFIIVAVLFLSNSISEYLFKSSEYGVMIALVSIGIGFKIQTFLQNSWITAIQKIQALAKASLYNGSITAFVSIVIAYYYSDKEWLIPTLVVLIPLVSWVVSTIQHRRFFKESNFSFEQASRPEIRPILKFGLSTLTTGVLQQSVAIITKTQIIAHFGLEYLGYYQVALGLMFQYMTFISTSISTDYYPRLVAKVAQKDSSFIPFVNQQIGLFANLLFPILLLMIQFAPFVVEVLYSAEFLNAVSLLEYGILGSLFLVICWPIAYVILAHRDSKIYILTESIGNITHLVLILISIRLDSFIGLGIAYVGHYVIYLALISFLFLTKYKGHFHNDLLKSFVFFISILVLVYVNKYLITSDLLKMSIFLLLFGIAVIRSKEDYFAFLAPYIDKIKRYVN